MPPLSSPPRGEAVGGNVGGGSKGGATQLLMLERAALDATLRDDAAVHDAR
jgi:hypothetical protein